jgi:hypothetical protein
MATPKAFDALKKTKQAIDDIKEKLELVVQRLNDDAFEQATTAQAQATVSLSIGTMKYMGARLQGLDHGRTQDDPLRQELNQMRKVLAAIKARNAATVPNRPVAKGRDPPRNDSLHPPSKKAKTTGGKESLTKTVTNKAPPSKAGSRKKKVQPKR